MKRRLKMLVALMLVICGAGFAQQQPEGEAFAVRIGMILPSPELDEALRQAADQGLEMAIDELGFNAELLGYELTVLVEEAHDPQSATAAAKKLLGNDLLAIAGGYGEGVAEAISAVASESQIPFLNIGSPSIALRNEQCSPWMFHIQPSGGMYLDAMAGWYVGAGFRDWYLILDESPDSQSLAERFEWTLQERHFGTRLVGRSVIDDDPESMERALERGADSDVIMMMVGGDAQLELMALAQELGIETELTGFPWPETQTREYYAKNAEAAPDRRTHRAAAWEPTLDAYGARELNARFAARFGELMDTAAWATYQAVKLTFEAVTFGGVRDRASLQQHLAAKDAVFDVWKGIGVTFRPWNHQMRQTLFLVEIQPGAESARDLAILVGELPAIYMPRTDPIERLDQLGDLENVSRCNF